MLVHFNQPKPNCQTKVSISYFIFHSKGVYGKRLVAKIPDMGLNNRNIFSQFGRLEVQDQGASTVRFW